MSSKIIAGTTAGTALNMSADTTGILEIQTGSTPTTAITVDTSQNVGIGTNTVSNPNGFSKAVNIIGGGAGTAGGALYVGNTTNLGIVGYYNSDMSINNIAAGNVVFYTNANNERMRIDSSGNLLVGSTATATYSARLNVYATSASVDTNIHSRTNVSTNKSHIIFGNATADAVGSIQTNGSATSFNTSSDYRLKENIAPMQNALNVVQQLKPVTYNWKADGSEGQGFIAHELQEIIPEAVTGTKNAVKEDGTPEYQGIDTSFLVATLTAAIQELNAKVEALEAKLA